MESLNALLARLPIPGLKASNERHLIAETITKELSIPVTAKQISFTDNIVTVSVQPVVKSALKIHQAELIECLSKKGITVRTFR